MASLRDYIIMSAFIATVLILFGPFGSVLESLQARLASRATEGLEGYTQVNGDWRQNSSNFHLSLQDISMILTQLEISPPHPALLEAIVENCHKLMDLFHYSWEMMPLLYAILKDAKSDLTEASIRIYEGRQVVNEYARQNYLNMYNGVELRPETRQMRISGTN